MPFSLADRPVARAVSKEAEKFARLLGTVPIVREWPDHPAVRPMLRSFRNINKALATRDARGYVTTAQQARMGREFQKLGAALQSRPQKRRAKNAKNAKKRAR